MNPAIPIGLLAALIVGGYIYVIYVGMKCQNEADEIRAEKRAKKKAKKKEKQRLKTLAIANSNNLNSL